MALCHSASNESPQNEKEWRGAAVNKAIGKHIRFLSIHNGKALKGHVADFLQLNFLYPLRGTIGPSKDPFQFLFDYFGVRYFLLLEHNELYPDCVENSRLREMWHAYDSQDSAQLEKFLWSTLDLFWPHVANNWLLRRKKPSMWEPSLNDRYAQKKAIKLQLKTIAKSRFCLTTHHRSLEFPPSCPVRNPCPGLPMLSMDQIEILEEIKLHVLKGKINGELCSVKISDGSRDLSREIEMLIKAPKIPNVPHILGCVGAGEGKLDKLIIKFVVGKTLREIKACSASDRSKWKAQLKSAVKALHEHGVIWGDVHPGNVVIEEETNRVVLIDFGGGCIPEWVDEALAGTIEGDLQGLGRLLNRIDKLPFPGDAKAGS